MKVSVKAKFLKRVIREARPVAAKASITYVRGKILMQVHGKYIEVSATDLNNGITLWDTAGAVYDGPKRVPAEGGLCVMSITDILPAKELKDNDDVLIEKDDDTVVFSANGVSFKAKTEDPTEFPDIKVTLRTPDAEHTSIDVCDISPFKFVQLAESGDGARPEFTGVSIQDGYVIATDGRRLHLAKIKPATSVSFNGVLRPSIVSFITSGHDGFLSEIRHNGSVLRHVIEGDGFSYWSKPIGGSFPDFRKVVPCYRSNEICEIEADVLANGIKPLFIGLKDATALGVFNANNGTDLLAWGKASKRSPMGEPRRGFLEGFHIPNLPIGVGLNPTYVTDALKAPVAGAVHFCAIDADSPVWIGDAERENGAVIMPIALSVTHV
jgi:DNA polymerase III sliding clamp (beta) subunit (PCNA family)